MTKGHIKKGKAGGNTFDLLRAVLADKNDKQAAALFAEFAKAFKGKRQLSWSNGLKAKFNLVEKDDEELAAELEDSAELLGLISPDEWRDVLKVKARATVLELAAAAGWPAVKKFLTFIDGCRDGVYEYDSAMVAERAAAHHGWHVLTHANRVCISAPFGGIGGSPLMFTL